MTVEVVNEVPVYVSVLVDVTEPREDQPLVMVVVARYSVKYV